MTIKINYGNKSQKKKKRVLLELPIPENPWIPVEKYYIRISQQCDVGFPHLCIFSTQPSTWDRVGVNMYKWNKCFSLYCPVQFSFQHIMPKLITNGCGPC